MKKLSFTVLVLAGLLLWGCEGKSGDGPEPVDSFEPTDYSWYGDQKIPLQVVKTRSFIVYRTADASAVMSTLRAAGVTGIEAHDYLYIYGL